jgi:ribosomal protein S18 acetylase RimI-like enzyme
MGIEIEILNDLQDPEKIQIVKALVDYNKQETAHLGENELRTFQLHARSDAGELTGGVIAIGFCGTLDVKSLVVFEKFRGNGIGKSLMRKVESLAIKSGYDQLNLDTFSFQALDLYEKLGFEIIGQYEDDKRGISRYYLKKVLN